MLSNIFWLLNYVRENILEAFILPDLGISYWEFLIYLAIAGVVIVVLINAVKVSGTISDSSKERKYQDTLRQRERVKHDERSKLKNGGSYNSGTDYDWFEKSLNTKD